MKSNSDWKQPEAFNRLKDKFPEYLQDQALIHGVEWYLSDNSPIRIMIRLQDSHTYPEETFTVEIVASLKLSNGESIDLSNFSELYNYINKTFTFHDICEVESWFERNQPKTVIDNLRAKLEPVYKFLIINQANIETELAIELL